MDTSNLDLENYNFEHIPSLISKHGGIGFYINKKYSYSIRNKYKDSNIWKGLAIDEFGIIL